MARRDLPEENNVVIVRPTRHWPAEALKHLADGIRDSNALHIITLFKYDEPVTVEDIRAAINAHYAYKINHNLEDEDVEVFLISTIPLRRSVLRELGYRRTKKRGVYRSHDPLFALIPIIFPAELSRKSYNASLKIIIGRKEQLLSAFDTLTTQLDLTEEVKQELTELRNEVAEGNEP